MTSLDQAMSQLNQEAIALGDVMVNIAPMGYQPNLMDVYNNPKSPAFESHLDPNYEFQNILKTPFGPVFYSTITDKGEANIAEQDALEGRNWGDTQYSDGATFPSMYDPAPPVVEPPVIQPPATQPGPTTSYEDSILFNFTPQERRSYLLNQINMGMDPTRGYTGPDGVYVDLTTVYPDIFNPDYVTFPDIDRPSIPDPLAKVGDWGTNPDYDYDNPTRRWHPHVPQPEQPPFSFERFDFGAPANVGDTWYDPVTKTTYTYLLNNPDGKGGLFPGWDITEGPGDRFYLHGMRGGGYVDDYRMNRGGIMDLREPHRYNRGGNVMRNIRDEQARVIGVQDDAADEMNRIRYHSGRDARDERFRVAARERDARAEMGRLRGEARYEDTHGRGPRLFNQGGVASLAPVARNMFRKRRLPRAGMVV